MNSTAKTIRVTAYGQTKEFPSDMTYAEIARSWEETSQRRVLLVNEDGSRLQEMNRCPQHDCSLTFLTLADKEGRDTYKRSLCLLMLRAFENVLGKEDVHVWIRFTVSGGLFCTLKCGHAQMTQELLDKVKQEMENLREAAVPIVKKSVRTEDAIRLFEANEMTDKAKLFRFRISSRCTRETSSSCLT